MQGRRVLGKSEMAQFIQDRYEALLSLDRDKIIAYAQKYGAKIPIDDDELFWCSVHKARTAMPGFPEKEKQKSLQWLKEKGYGPFGAIGSRKEE